MTSLSDLSDLDSKFAHLADERESRRAAAYAGVVRWEWYEGDAFDLQPLWHERNLLRPGRRLDRRPPLTQDHYQLGFDVDDRVVTVLEYSGFLNGRLVYETLRMYRADLIEEAHYNADGRGIYLREYLLESGRIRSTASAATFGGDIETYDYIDNSVVRIEVQHAKRASGALRHPTPQASIEAMYDGEGLLRLTSINPGRLGETLYERPPADFSIDAARSTVQAELGVQVLRAVREFDLEAAAYCVALAYADGFDPSAVTVHVGLEEDRQAFLAEGDDEDGDGEDIVWSPADMTGYADIDMSAVRDTARLLAQELRLSKVAVSRETVCAVAVSLGELDWQTIMPVTDDFVVFAVDLEMADLAQNLAAAGLPRNEP
ncbi:hypothetical protein [Actinospica robiniae]|uniref:hypothetical protein n=1 Tax=Actinospica robiniae TaxID=304901 RepID=UPI00041C8E38|nr:hypothetical protein [Actinospica robiniae]